MFTGIYRVGARLGPGAAVDQRGVSVYVRHQGLDLLYERGEIGSHRVPDLLEVDLPIAVNKFAACPGNQLPGHFWMCCPEFW